MSGWIDVQRDRYGNVRAGLRANRTSFFFFKVCIVHNTLTVFFFVHVGHLHTGLVVVHTNDYHGDGIIISCTSFQARQYGVHVHV